MANDEIFQFIGIQLPICSYATADIHSKRLNGFNGFCYIARM